MNQKQTWNAIAPEWYEYKEKPSKLSIEFLKKQTGKVLDLGSGAGRHLMKIKKGKMYLVDFSEQMISLAKQRQKSLQILATSSKRGQSKAKQQNINAEFIVADMTKLPFENNFFGSGISISAIHCLPLEYHKKAIQELYRVLKPKAQALISVWNKDSKRFKNSPKEKYIGWTDKGKRYYYLFTEDEIHNLFKKSGFKIISTHNSELMIRFIVEGV